MDYAFLLRDYAKRHHLGVLGVSLISSDLLTDAADEIDRLRDAVTALQRHLNFWLPNAPGDDSPLSMALAESASLLMGYDGPAGLQNAEDMGWISVTHNAKTSNMTANLIARLRDHAAVHHDIAHADPEQMQWMDDLYEAADALEGSSAELDRLRARERACQTMAEAESRALLRAMQECRDMLDLPKSASPAQVVDAVRALRSRHQRAVMPPDEVESATAIVSPPTSVCAIKETALSPAALRATTLGAGVELDGCAHDGPSVQDS